VPFGANVGCTRELRDIEALVAKRCRDVCRLLFLGVDWARKGGDVALQVADLLNRRGIRTELHVAGCEPPMVPPPFVTCHGFISKSTEQGRNRLDQLMADSHFLILPSRAECFGVVFAEASSFGLPSLATRVGGIPAAVRDGRNGQTFALDASPDEYSNYIETLLVTPERYRALALSSFEEYRTRLNWTSAANRVMALIEEHCGPVSPPLIAADHLSTVNATTRR
jgi:glycosyltransferase involved in cell wall biosynthesis